MDFGSNNHYDNKAILVVSVVSEVLRAQVQTGGRSSGDWVRAEHQLTAAMHGLRQPRRFPGGREISGIKIN